MCRTDEEIDSNEEDKKEDVPTPSVDDEEEKDPSPVEPDTVVSTDKASTPEKTAPYRTDPAEYDTFLERYSVRVANRPCLYFWLSLLISLGVGMVGLTVGDFSVAVDNAGWYSRGTLISNRQQQFWLVDTYRAALFADDEGSLWQELETKR